MAENSNANSDHDDRARPCRLANAVRLTLNPSSVADVEGVRDVALALKATKKLVSKTDAKWGMGGGAKDKDEGTEPQPLYPNAPR